MIVLLQLEWVIDFSPDWLGPLFIFTGIAIMLRGALNMLTDEYRDHTADIIGVGPKRLFGAWKGITIMSASVFLGLLFKFESVVILVLVAVGQYIGGAGAARTYHKFSYLIKNRRWPFSGTLTAKLKVYPLLFIMSILLIDLFARIVTPIRASLLLSWTLIVFLFSAAGFYFRTKKLHNTRVGLMNAGAVLALAGANISNLSLVFDLTAYAVSSLAYSIGFLISIQLLHRG